MAFGIRTRKSRRAGPGSDEFASECIEQNYRGKKEGYSWLVEGALSAGTMEEGPVLNPTPELGLKAKPGK